MTKLNVETTLFGPDDQGGDAMTFEAPVKKPTLTLVTDSREALDKFHDGLFAAFDTQNETLWNRKAHFWPEVRMERYDDYLGRDTLKVTANLGVFTFEADFYQSPNPLFESPVQASLGGRGREEFVTLPLVDDRKAFFLKGQNIAALHMNFKDGKMCFLRPDRTEVRLTFGQAQALLHKVTKERKKAVAQEEAERPEREAMEERWKNFYGNGVMGLGAYGLRFDPGTKKYELVEGFKPFLCPRRENGNATNGKPSRRGAKPEPR